MPLKKGYSSKTRSTNISEMMHSYEKTGKIGNTTPRNKDHAQQIAIAASYTSARESAKKKKKRAIVHSLMPRKKY